MWERGFPNPTATVPGAIKHPLVKVWLAQHPRFHLHFTLTSSSWLNLVECFFRDLTDDVLREGAV